MEVPLLIWEVATAYFGGCHCLSGRLPLLIWWVGGKMNLRIRLTSAKVGVGVEVEAELGNKKLTELNLSATKMQLRCNIDATYIQLRCNLNAN